MEYGLGQGEKKVYEPWTKQIHAGLSTGYVFIPKEIDYAILGQCCWGAETGFLMGKKWWRFGTTLKHNSFYFKTLADLKDAYLAGGQYGNYFFKGNTKYNSNALLLSQFIQINFLRKFKIHPFETVAKLKSQTKSRLFHFLATELTYC